MDLFHFVRTVFGHIIRRYEIMLTSHTHLNSNSIIFKTIVIVFTVIWIELIETVLNHRLLHLNTDRTTNWISVTFVITLRNGQIFVNKRTELIRTVRKYKYVELMNGCICCSCPELTVTVFYTGKKPIRNHHRTQE